VLPKISENFNIPRKQRYELPAPLGACYCIFQPSASQLASL